MPNEELKELRAELLRIGGQLGTVPRESETAADFARRCVEAARRLRLGAGVTWADYELIKIALPASATFALRKPPESSPLGGPRWTIKLGEGLDELAGRLGLYEDQT